MENPQGLMENTSQLVSSFWFATRIRRVFRLRGLQREIWAQVALHQRLAHPLRLARISSLRRTSRRRAVFRRRFEGGVLGQRKPESTAPALCFCTRKKRGHVLLSKTKENTSTVFQGSGRRTYRYVSDPQKMGCVPCGFGTLQKRTSHKHHVAFWNLLNTHTEYGFPKRGKANQRWFLKLCGLPKRGYPKAPIQENWSALMQGMSTPPWKTGARKSLQSVWGAGHSQRFIWT